MHKNEAKGERRVERGDLQRRTRKGLLLIKKKKRSDLRREIEIKDLERDAR